MRLLTSQLPSRSPKLRDAQDWWDQPIIPPPYNSTVTDHKKVILYRPDGTPLVRKVGFV